MKTRMCICGFLALAISSICTLLAEETSPGGIVYGPKAGFQKQIARFEPANWLYALCQFRCSTRLLSESSGSCGDGSSGSLTSSNADPFRKKTLVTPLVFNRRESWRTPANLSTRPTSRWPADSSPWTCTATLHVPVSMIAHRHAMVRTR